MQVSRRQPSSGAGARAPRYARGFASPPLVALGVCSASFARSEVAEACPSCATGESARSEVWADDFGYYLCVALLPFVIIGAICAYVERRGAERAQDARPARAALDRLERSSG